MRLAKMAKAAVVAGMIVVGGPASAGTYTARLSNILLYEGGGTSPTSILEGGTQAQRPACAGSNGDYLSFSLARPRAKEYLATLMMAFAMGKRVTIWASGSCIDQGISETIEYIQINND